MDKTTQKSYVPLEVIEGKLLAALDEKSKVAIVVDADDLELLCWGMCRFANNDRASRLLAGLRELQASAFGAAEAGKGER